MRGIDMSMNIKAFVAGAVGVLACASTAWGQSDCNANQMDDQLEIATGRGFDLDSNQTLDECEHAAKHKEVAKGHSDKKQHGARHHQG